MIAKIVSIFLTRSLAFCDFLWLDVEFVFLLRVRERKSYYRGMRENCRPPWSRRLEKLLIFSRWPRVIFHLHLRPLAGLCTRIRFMAPWPRRSPEDREFVEDARERLRIVDLCNINYSPLVFSASIGRVADDWVLSRTVMAEFVFSSCWEVLFEVEI